MLLSSGTPTSEVLPMISPPMSTINYLGLLPAFVNRSDKTAYNINIMK